MTEKSTGKSTFINNDNTKHPSVVHRSGQIIDFAKLYRREQVLKKKMKGVLQANINLQKQIKIHQSQIRQERSNIIFLLNDLVKQMNTKIHTFQDCKLERSQFTNNEIAHETIQKMMQDYEKIQKQSNMLKRIYESVSKVSENYSDHQKDMEQLVSNIEHENRTYEDSINEIIGNLKSQIQQQKKSNNKITQQTKQQSKGINHFAVTTIELVREENSNKLEIEKLNKIIKSKHEKVNEMEEWHNIVIDKANRNDLFKKMASMEEKLAKMKQSNNKKEIYLGQLDNQQEAITRQKKQAIRIPQRAKSVKSKAKSSLHKQNMSKPIRQ